jgi:mxaK protein
MRTNIHTLQLIIGILVTAVIVEGYQLYSLWQVNQAISSPHSETIDENSAAGLVFAKAWHLARTGESREALSLYNSLQNRANGEMLEKVIYNMGHIYLTQAAELWNSQGVWAYSKILTWSGLAEKTLREVVASNPANWDARFNLEYTLRISPPPREVEKTGWTGHKSSVFSIYPGGVSEGGP